jgi:hypothetical protein
MSTITTTDMPTPRHAVAKTSKPPTIGAEGYVNPGGTVGIQLQNVWAWVTTAKFRSAAFEGGLATDYPATITPTEGGKLARTQVTIGADVEIGTYEVIAVLQDGVIEYKQWLTVEGKHDGKVVATLTPVDDQGLMDLRVEPLSRNGQWGDVRTAANWHKPGEQPAWQALSTYDRATGIGHGTVVTTEVKPGTYPIDVRQQFPGGHEEIISGTVTVPNTGGRPVGEQFIVDVPINLSKAIGDQVVHKIPFGKDHEQDNTDYLVDVDVTVLGKDGKKYTGTVTREEALAFSTLRHPWRVDKHETGIKIHTIDTGPLHGNDRFRLTYHIGITPSAAGGTTSVQSDPGDWSE